VQADFRGLTTPLPAATTKSTRMIIFHAADIHLGRRRLDGRLPDADLASAFGHVVDAAIAEGADVFVLAGDLFDRAQVEPPHLRQAQTILGRLRAAKIPVVAIEGNHDKPFISSATPTWLDFLAQDDLLILLRTPFTAEGPRLEEWNTATKTGAWIDLGGVRFTGAGYLGAATPLKVRQIAAQLDPTRTHVLLLHAGPDYFVGEGGGFSAEDLRLLHERVCYLALGHIHKPMRHGDWACNPGSPENCELREALQQGPRGYARVEIDPAHRIAPRSLEIRDTPRRPCAHLDLDCTPFGNKLKDGAAALEKAAVKLIAAHQLPPEAAVMLRLGGKVNLSRLALDHETLSRSIQQAANVAAVALDLAGLNLQGFGFSAAGSEEVVSRQDLELTALRSLVAEESLWGLDTEEETAVQLFYHLKEGVRLEQSTEELAEMIRTSPLVEKIYAAAQAAPMEGAAP